MKKEKFWGFFILALAISLCSGYLQSSNVFSADKKPQIIIRVALGGPTSEPMYMAMDEILVKEVAKNTDGHIKFEVYPAAQLGDEVKSIESVRTGVLEMAPVTTAPMVGMVKEYAIFDIPFLFNNSEEALKILNGRIGERLGELTLPKDMYVLGCVEFGFRHVTNSVRDIKKPEDIKGLKIRTMENPIHIAAWRALGANPTPMPVSEVFTAMQQHAIDGQENPISAIYGWKFYEVNKHLTLTGHIYSPKIFLFSKKIFDTYSAEDQTFIKRCVAKVSKRTLEINQAKEEEYIKQMKASGCTVTTLTSAEKAAFKKVTEPIWKMVSDKVGPEMMELLQSELKKVNR